MKKIYVKLYLLHVFFIYYFTFTGKMSTLNENQCPK